jgi:hypothetical protein
LAVTLGMVRINFEDIIPVFFGTTMAIVVVITICCAVLQTSLFGLATEFPMDLGIMGAVMGGQGCGGIFACVVNLITLGESCSSCDRKCKLPRCHQNGQILNNDFS